MSDAKPRWNKLYTDYEDFDRKFMPSAPETKRYLVLGITGAAKSSLLNCLSGFPLVRIPVEDDYFGPGSFILECPGRVFPLGHGPKSATQSTGWALVRWMGKKDGQQLVAIDSPGLCDTLEKRELHMPDWQAKMKKIGTLHAILIVLADIANPRVTQTTRSFLNELNIAFDVGMGGEKQSIWNNVAICFAKCNNDSRSSWTPSAREHKKALPCEIQNVFNTKHKVPVFFLSTIEGQMPRLGSNVDQLQELEKFISSRKPLETQEVKQIKEVQARLNELKLKEAKREKDAERKREEEAKRKREEEDAKRKANWITHMRTFGGLDNVKALLSYPTGYTLFKADLNQGAKKSGDYVYLAYRSVFGAKPIGDVKVFSRRGKAMNTEELYLDEWNLCKKDCNQNSRGNFVYIGYRYAKDGDYPITGFHFTSKGHNHPVEKKGYQVVVGDSHDGDLNHGAGGDFNYLYVEKSSIQYKK